MHGVLRVRTTEEERSKRRKERKAELVIFRSQVKDIFEKRSNKEYSDESLKLTAEVLIRNPDFYTLWNYRREILIDMSKTDTEKDMTEYFDTELRLTESCLKANPKSYCTWYHRIWIMKTRKNPNWLAELKLCNIYLKLDERNLHCWNYRNYIVENAKVDLSEEFNYCLSKIQENFSNYSAWHYRSKLLMKLYSDGKDRNLIEEKVHATELDLVLNAVFTDPNDSSAWFYQRWLLGITYKPPKLAVCRVSAACSYFAFSKAIKLINPEWPLVLEIDGKIIDGVWESTFNKTYDVLWNFEHKKNFKFHKATSIMICLKYNNMQEKIECNIINGIEYIGYANANFEKNLSVSVRKTLCDQAEKYEELLELEPENRWTYLTLAMLRNCIGHMENYEQNVVILKNLGILDPQRSNYYKDLLSRWHIEYCIQKDIDVLKTGKFNFDNKKTQKIVLTNIYHGQYWSASTVIDLRGHRITTKNLPKLKLFRNCVFLDLGENDLKSLYGFPHLPKLKRILLDGNGIDLKDETPNLRTLPELCQVGIGCIGV